MKEHQRTFAEVSHAAVAVFFFILTISVHAEKKPPVVAVLPFQSQNAGAGEELAGILSAEILSRNSFPIVERNQLKKALEEITKNQNGLFNPDKSPQLGLLVGAEFLIIGELFPGKDNKHGVVMRVVKAETGVVIGALSTSGTLQEMAKPLSARAIETISIYSSLENPDSPYSILLQLTKGKNPSYKLGEKMQVKFKVLKHSTSAPSRVFLSLYYVGADGSMTLMYPNRFTDKEGIYVDEEYVFPGPNDDFEWKLVPPLGAETIQAFVSTKPVRLFNERVGSDDLKPLSQKESAATYRGIQTELKEEKKGDWAAERVTYILSDK